MPLGQAYAGALPASHRRMLRDAAEELIDTTLHDLCASDAPDWSADNWLIGTLLPARYKLRSTGDFARKFFVCLITVIWKLGQREAVHPSCVAEELAAHILIRAAFFEDLDGEYLYDDASDGIETLEIAEGMGITNLAFGEWFERFGPPETSSYTEVHPYAQDNGDAEVEAFSS